MIDQIPIQSLIRTIENEASVISRPSSYLGKSIDVVAENIDAIPKSSQKANAESILLIKEQFKKVMQSLESSIQKPLDSIDVTLLGDLKSALNSHDLTQDFKCEKEDLLNLIDRLQELEEIYIPQEMVTTISGYAKELKAETSPSFFRARAELFQITAQECTSSLLLKNYLPKADENLSAELFVKGIYNNLMKEIVQFDGSREYNYQIYLSDKELTGNYDKIKQELREKYGASITTQRLEEMSLWVQLKHDENLIGMTCDIIRSYPTFILSAARNTIKDQPVQEQAKLIRNFLNENQTELKKLISLDFTTLGLEVLPKEIGLFVGLEELLVTENELKMLPPEIGNLTQLTDLYINSNTLIDLPKELTKLVNLRHLDLSGNELEFLPDGIGNWINLETLNLSNNNFKFLTEELEDLPALRRISVCQRDPSTVIDLPNKLLDREKDGMLQIIREN